MKLYGDSGREFYRLEEKAHAQQRAAWTVASLAVLLVVAVFLGWI